MKKTTLILITTLLFSCCNKDDNEIINPIDQLPESTQIGANTAGCLVDGEAIYPNSFGDSMQIYYDGVDFTLLFSNKKNNIDRVIFISSLNHTLNVGETYLLKEVGDEDTTNFGQFSLGSSPPPRPGFYTTTETITGELTITHHDFDNAFLSGTFWFNAVNSIGEIVEIREGRFDAEY